MSPPYNPAEYDPAERRERYLRDRQLKGKAGATAKSPKGPKPPKNPQTTSPKKPPKPPATTSKDTPARAKERVASLTAKIKTLEGALTKAMAALSEKRRNSKQSEKEDSDGKSTAAEKKASKEYREKNQSKISEKRKKESSSGGSSSSSKSVDDMDTGELEARISKLKTAIKSAKSQLAEASKIAGFSHSADQGDFHLRLPSTPIRKESVKMTADFGGYATRHDVECADGRTIRPEAFDDHDGKIVPLVFQHGHKDIHNVLGHCKLEYRPEGVYAHAFFNDTPAGRDAKTQVQHGDLKYLSIFANNLRERAKNGVAHAKEVLKGEIREVSLVLAGANPGAYIDNISFQHSDGTYELDTSEAIVSFVVPEAEISLEHAAGDDKDSKSVQDVLDTLNEEQTIAVNYLLSEALTSNEKVKHDDTGSDEDEDDSENDESEGSEEQDGEENNTDGEDADGTEAGEDVQHDNTQEDTSMTHNLFDAAGKSQDARPTASLSHSDVASIVESAQEIGSLKKAVMAHVAKNGITVNGELKHGIENIDYLFPDAQLIENSPQFVSRRMEWVDKVLNGVRKSPFSRIKTITADITPDEARARGYITGNLKNEEFFALSKRETTPQTIYKKQKLDRDDVIDITTLDVVAWLKAEMKVMLDEELAGAILVGDGRSIGDEDKIKETNIRPIASDSELYVTTVNVNLDDASSSIEELVDAVIENRRYYKGSGQPAFFTTEGVISRFLTVKDNFGRRIYANLAEVAAVLRVSEIIPVEVMERVPDLVGVMVNLADYTLGADRGGQATMFDDFDIDYNKLRYLIETRVSGALTQPKSAVVFRKVAGTSALRTPVEPAFADNTVTVPTVTGVTYKNAETNATLVTATPVELEEGEVLHVIAVPAAGSYFANNAEDEWIFTGK